ncbi:LPS-assembly protein LptD [Castellaniella sp.]|uniref:LPS-assembly protein LptD n=1 Tax=Castellaniella sp. TaxID=1955812 RepID=UPI00355F1814
MLPSIVRPALLCLCLVTSVWAAGPGAQTTEHSNDADAMRMVGSLRLHPAVSEEALPAFLMGDQVTRDAQGQVLLQGDAQVRRLDAVVKGDRITHDQASGQVDVHGNGLLMRDGHIVRGPHLRYNIKTDQGEIEAPRFWLGATAGRGRAEQAEIFSRDHMRLTDMRYSNFDGPDPAWWIESSKVDLYMADNEGVARNGVLYFKGVPLLYSPYLSFPLRQERKSGFLLPYYGTSSNAGMEITTPYYLNLAPNYDATLYPRYMSKRGLLMGLELRHLGPGSYTQAFGTFNPKDRVLQEHRWMYSVQHEQSLGSGFNAYLDARKVSDDDYFRDYSSFTLSDAAITHLPSRALLTWSDDRYFSAYLEYYRYQTLQDVTGTFLAPPYDLLPRLNFTAQHYNWNGFDVVSQNEITRFVAPVYRGSAFPSQSGRRIMPNGTRMISYTSVSRPFVEPGVYVTPKLGLHVSQYDTDWFEGSPSMVQYAGRPRSQTRVLPIASVDAGLTFERDASLFGNAAIQTLEPRLYYLYVPYRNQDDLPVYDTSVATFNFMQAFDENIYSGGWDRISNANQLTAGLTTRWMDADTGVERLSLSAAQRFYFADQEVVLPGQTPRTADESDFLIGAAAALTDRFSINFDGQFGQKTFKGNRLSAGIRWTPKRLASVSLSYRYERDPSVYSEPYSLMPPSADQRAREQVSLTAQWPFSSRWHAVGRYDYSLVEKRNVQSIAGIEYRGDGGWAARAVVQRYAVSAEDANTSLFLQLELSGLGSLGTDPMSLLSDRITGYQSTTPVIPEKSQFERYD